MDAGKASIPAAGPKQSMEAEVISTPAEGSASTGGRTSGSGSLARRRSKLQVQKAVAELRLSLAVAEANRSLAELEEEEVKSRCRLDQSSSPALMQQVIVEAAKEDAG